MPRIVTVGVVGAGKHGQRYLRHIRQDVPALALAALSRQDRGAGAAQAAELGCRFHADWRALVDDPAVEAVVAVVPPSLHPAVAAATAAARKPLLIEKPLATTGAAAAEIVRLVRAAGVPCLMAHTLRWNGVVAAVRDHLPGLGTLRALVLNQRFEPSRLAWLDDPAVAGGGIILHTGVHGFDLVRHLTGREVTTVWCRSFRAVTTRTEDNFLAQLALDGSDALVAVGGSRSSGGRSGLIDVAADGGQLVADHQLGFAWTVRGLDRTPIPLPAPVPTVCSALEAFARLVLGGAPPPVTLEDGARAVLVAEACARSAAADGARVDVEPLRP